MAFRALTIPRMLGLTSDPLELHFVLKQCWEVRVATCGKHGGKIRGLHSKHGSVQMLE